MESLRGHLLIASPALLDPNFRRTVVLVTEHTDDGAAGLVLNRPSLVEVAAAVPQLEELVDADEQVWVGGPVQPEAVLVLGEFLDPDDAAVPLFESLGFPSLDEPEEIVPATTRRRVFPGYAGWSDLPEPAPEPPVPAWLDPMRRRRLDDEQHQGREQDPRLRVLQST